MGKYLIWMMRYSDALRKVLRGNTNVNAMSYDELLKLLESSENSKNYMELTSFLEYLGHSNLSLEDKAIKLEENYDKYFKAA